MGEVTTLAKNSPNFASLRTTLPINIVKQWNLRPGSQLDWSWEVVNGEMVLVVRKVESEVTERDLNVVWSNLMRILCERHRDIRRNKGRSVTTDYVIEQLRRDHFGAFTSPGYFRRLIYELARRHHEVEVEGDIVRLRTANLIANCRMYVPNFQSDFTP
jgi:hypothetical protein